VVRIILILFSLAALGALVAALVSGKITVFNAGGKKDGGKKPPSWLGFLAKGRESGFSTGEIKTLYELARRSKIEYPTALFWSQTRMDACIKYVVEDSRGAARQPENDDFLSRLYDFRKKMEMNRPKNRLGLRNSREIDELQLLQIVLSGTGVFISKVLRNGNSSFTIARPDCSELPANFEWKNKKVLVYFLRPDDANYCFESTVLEENFSPESNTLRLTHSEDMQRTQNRRSLRAKTKRPALLYPAGTAGDEEMRVVSGIKCCLEDISDTGCAVSVEGRIQSELGVIIQFSLDGNPLSLSGTVRSVNYREDTDTSLLHIQCDLMPENTKNLIMGVVLGFINDDIDIVSEQGDGETADSADDFMKPENC
jgi:c-di-GMP-binding flagellar brake protein YcgR